MPIGPNKDLDFGMTATPARPDGAGAAWFCMHHEETCEGETCCCADTHVTDPEGMAAGRAYIASDHDPDSEWQTFRAGFAAGAAAERARAERLEKAARALIDDCDRFDSMPIRTPIGATGPTYDRDLLDDLRAALAGEAGS